MNIEYEACPLCYSKKVIKEDRGTVVIIKCGECKNQIDRIVKNEQAD